MRRLALGLLCLNYLGVLAGCGSRGAADATAEKARPASEQSGGVAVIDLDEVARQLGRESMIRDALQQRQTVLNEQLSVLQTSYQNQVNDRKRELGDQPTPDGEQQIQALERQANVQLQQVRTKAQNDLATHRSTIINSFRDEVKPHAAQVAADRGLSIVVPKNEVFLFAYDPGVDITSAVVKKMLATVASGAKPAAVPEAVAYPEPAPLPDVPHQPIQP